MVKHEVGHCLLLLTNVTIWLEIMHIIYFVHVWLRAKRSHKRDVLAGQTERPRLHGHIISQHLSARSYRTCIQLLDPPSTVSSPSRIKGCALSYFIYIAKFVSHLNMIYSVQDREQYFPLRASFYFHPPTFFMTKKSQK